MSRVRTATYPRLVEETPIVTVDFTVTEVTHRRRNSHYHRGHELRRATVMTRLWRNSLEAVAAIGTIVLGTLVVHLAMSWWSASAALH
jgi:hypothetical protein